ncbi:MAG: branched-chain amino acid ABC transporter permease [Actinomycetota bacterium]|nr:branched-chain amino acid ABC transporter permease [Actinomycetota bacterium]
MSVQVDPVRSRSGSAGGGGSQGAGLPAWLSRQALGAFVVALVAIYLLPFTGLLGPYTHNLLALTFMFMSAALAWNWLGGYVGQISFGHSAMFGVGGFVSARLLISTGLPFWAAWIVGGVVAGLFGLAWGHPTLRLRGPYFSIATIGVAEATRLIMTYWADFTGGSSGVSLPLEGAVTKFALYYYGLYLLAIVVAISYVLRKSRIGLGLLAIKEDVEAAGDVGVNATLYQDIVLFLSGAVVGVCGGFYASYFSFIEPGDIFGFDRSISFVLMGVIGGIGTILGPVLGALTFVVIQEALLASYPDLYLGLYGLLLVLIILFEPLGLSGLLMRIGRRVGYRPPADAAAGGLTSSTGADPDVLETAGDDSTDSPQDTAVHSAGGRA